MPSLSSSNPMFSSSLGPVKIKDVTNKKPIAVFQGSKLPTTPSTVNTNHDISMMFMHMKTFMDQQNITNQRILREIEDIKKSKKHMEEVSPYMPKALDFNTLGSLAQQNMGSMFQPSTPTFQQGSSMQNQQGSFNRPGSSNFQGSYNQPGSSMPQGSFHQVGSSMQSLSSPPLIQNQGSFLKNLGSSSMQWSKVAEIHDNDIIPMQTNYTTAPSISVEMQRLEYYNGAGYSQPGDFKICSSNCDAEIPKRFQTPNMKLYDRFSDPEEHVAQYRERMEINHIPKKLKEACLCKVFGSTLTGSALKWLLSLPPYSITLFAYLVNLFNNQFSCSRSFERLTSDLYRITQSNSESLRDYVSKFGIEVLEIRNLDMATAVQAFKMGLKKDSPFYDDLVMTPCRNLDEVRTRALRFIRLEDDKKIQDRIGSTIKQEHQDKKQESLFKNNKTKPYFKHDNQNVHAMEYDEDEEEYPKISEYCFSDDISDVLLAMQDLGEKARWPRKTDKAVGYKDKSKWCSYHEDFDHITDECIALRREIGYLLSKGHSKDLFGRKKQRNQDPEKVLEKAAQPPPDARVINFISGGSDICGTSYSAAKRNTRECKLECGE
ncbi:hypothetical protein QVD17_37753 [Tagetes erecta]|uniref:Retrotransposon gag domain-containing protein n=1 Tax=Tagetes erecta TaxID=13708 RepID=A0AAD8JYW0_TARER|nr:hypothetical protein QVD17_37753 [Tagetes erecta]